jgi:hypothetical protein
MVLEKIFKCIDGKRHEHYEYTKEKAEFYEQLVTGLDQDELIVSYKPRETEEQKKQRIRLYHDRTKDVCNRISAQFDKIATVEHVAQMTYTDNNEVASSKLSSAVSLFTDCDPKTLQQYVFERCKYYNMVDPNAWLIVAYMVKDGGEILSYPIEFDSDDVADYKYSFGKLDYLIVFEEVTVRLPKKQKKEVKAWYGFEANNQVLVIEAISNAQDDEYLAMVANAELITVGNKSYYVVQTPTPNSVTPAIRWGYVPDSATDNETFVSIYDAATSQFKDLISRKSEYDLSLALHTFLQKFQVAETCQYRPENEPFDRCVNGRLSSSGSECPSCKGTGVKVHTTAQDVIFVKPADTANGEQNIPLSEMAHYTAMPFDIVRHQSEIVDKLPKEISISVFGVDVNTRPSGNPTATEIKNHYDSLYAVLYAFAQQVSNIWTFCVYRIAEQHGISANLVAAHKYPKDFDLMSDADYVTLLDNAKKSNAAYPIIEAYEDKIINKLYPDNPSKAQLVKILRKFMPFKGLQQSTIDTTIATLPSNDKNKVLYLNNDLIFTDMLEENPDFILMPYAKQRELVAQYTQRFIDQNITVQPVSLNNFA